MKNFLEGWKLWATVVVGTVAVVTITWGATGAIGIRPALNGEVNAVREIAENNSRRLDADRYFFLDKKRQSSQGLTNSEKIELCELARRLGFRCPL